MKKILCIAISLFLMLSTCFTAVYADNGKEKGKNDLEYWKAMLKQWHKHQEKRNEYIKEIVKLKRQMNEKHNIIFINGEELITDVPHVIKDGRTLLPVRAVTTALGADVQWIPETRTAVITKGTTRIVIAMDSKIVYVNGKAYTIDVPAKSENGRIVVPVRFIAEIFKQKVIWDPDTGSIIIEDDDKGDDENKDEDKDDSNNSTNLAYNRLVSSSSEYSSSYSAWKAVDGRNSTKWSSEFGSSPQWIYVDLGSSKSVNRIKLNWDTAYAKSYKIYKSSDASGWTEIYSTENGDGGIDNIVFASTNARYIKLYATQRATQYGYSLWELEVYGPGAAEEIQGRKYEAENAVLSNGAAINNNHSGYSGTGFVDGYWNQGATTTFNVNVEKAGKYDITLRYANAEGSNRTISIYVNGNKVKQISLSNLSGWDSWANATERLDLRAGSNTVAYVFDSGDNGCINLDYIYVNMLQ
ncbi:MAG: stalk domain-containing protein [Clostridia bacterium]|nr:stalk domain-containing protein [Clostridia bacterium]